MLNTYTSQTVGESQTLHTQHISELKQFTDYVTKGHVISHSDSNEPFVHLYCSVTVRLVGQLVGCSQMNGIQHRLCLRVAP